MLEIASHMKLQRLVIHVNCRVFGDKVAIFGHSESPQCRADAGRQINDLSMGTVNDACRHREKNAAVQREPIPLRPPISGAGPEGSVPPLPPLAPSLSLALASLGKGRHRGPDGLEKWSPGVNDLGKLGVDFVPDWASSPTRHVASLYTARLSTGTHNPLVTGSSLVGPIRARAAENARSGILGGSRRFLGQMGTCGRGRVPSGALLAVGPRSQIREDRVTGPTGPGYR